MKDYLLRTNFGQTYMPYYAVAGLVTWLLWIYFQFQAASSLAVILLFAILVIAPLVTGLVHTPRRDGTVLSIYRTLVIIFPVAAFLAVLSFFLTPGLSAAVLITPWFIFTVMLASFGLWRFFSRSTSLEEACIDFGLIYTAIGGIWLLFSRGGVQFLGFSEPIVTLTAVHFHYIGLVALVFTGMVGRRIIAAKSKIFHLYKLAALSVIVAPILIAFGISFLIVLESVAAIFFVVGMLTVAALNVVVVVPTASSRIIAVLLVLASMSVMVAMFFAAGYALGRLSGAWFVTISTMIQTHGWLNAVGFGLFSSLAWQFETPRSRISLPGIPFSQFVGGRFIGPAYFEQFVDKHRMKPPQGLVDNLQEYQGPGFEGQHLHSDIRMFYEKTACHKLLVYPEWKKGFGFLSRFYKKISSKIGQMNLPITPESEEDLINSRIIPLLDQMDGRGNVRAWIRTYEKNEKAVYVAAYANHSYREYTYMNIAFPLPGGNLTSVLRLETKANGDGGLVLSTLQQNKDTLWGDEGVYFSTRRFAFRLPVNETIQVWADNAKRATARFKILAPSETRVTAQHRMWLFGIEFLTLYYFIYKEEVDDSFL